MEYLILGMFADQVLPNLNLLVTGMYEIFLDSNSGDFLTSKVIWQPCLFTFLPDHISFPVISI